MTAAIVLRPVTDDDASLLLTWRNDPLTLRNSHNRRPVAQTDHKTWLARKLADAECRFMIGEVAGVPVGNVRADRRDGAWLLSWTIAPEARGKGYGQAMVAAILRALQGPVRAKIKAGNWASERIANAAGMKRVIEREGISYWECMGKP